MNLAIGDFEGLVNELFEVLAEQEGEVFTRLQLTEVSRLRHGHPDRAEPFSLIFVGSRDRALDQETYMLNHPTLGHMEIFLVPIGEKDDFRSYQAIFN